MFKTYDHVAVTGMTNEGQGIAHINERICFIQGGIQGEVVNVKITKKRKGQWFGIVTEVIQASSLRIKPPCPVYELCGGCNLQHVDNHTQMNLKQQPLLDQLKYTLGYLPEQIDQRIMREAWGYRRKARLSVRYVQKKQALLIGFRERHTHWVVNTDYCHILPKLVVSALQKLARVIEQFEHRDMIPQIELAHSENQTCFVIRHLVELTDYENQQLVKFGQDNNIWIMTQAKKPYDLVKLWPNDHLCYLSYLLHDQGLNYDFHPSDFIQVNADVNQACVNKLLDWANLNGSEIVLDLFCGLGNFSLPLAQSARWVDGYELSEEMVIRAKGNARKNNLTNVDFFATDLSAIQGNKWLKRSKYDLVVIDPPRCGAKEVMSTFKKILPSRIIYISCHWATMIRDCQLLADQYKVSKLVVMDMFPQTYHIEVMVLLEVK